MMKSPHVETILQNIKQSTERQRALEQEQVRLIGELNCQPQGSEKYNDDVLSLQSTLRELEKKIQLETVHYEELMLELTLSKKHEKQEDIAKYHPGGREDFGGASTPQSVVSSSFAPAYSLGSLPASPTRGGQFGSPHHQQVYLSQAPLEPQPPPTQPATSPQIPRPTRLTLRSLQARPSIWLTCPSPPTKTCLPPPHTPLTSLHSTSTTTLVDTEETSTK